MGRGAIHASFEGSAGRLGKNFLCIVSRKSGSDGSRSGILGGWGKCTSSEGRVGSEEVGIRFAGGDGGAASSSNVTVFVGFFSETEGLGGDWDAVGLVVVVVGASSSATSSTVALGGLDGLGC